MTERETLEADYSHIEPAELNLHFHVYLDRAAKFTPGNVDSASRPFTTNEIPSKTRWFPMAASRVQTSFPPEIDYWVNQAATVLEIMLNDPPLGETIFANLNTQYELNPHQLSLPRAMEIPFKYLFDKIFATGDLRIIIGFLAAFIPNGLDGLGLIFIHLDMFLANNLGNDLALKQFFLDTSFDGQFVNSEMGLSETNCPYKSFSITAIDKHIYAAVRKFYDSHAGISIARTPNQRNSNMAELSLLAGKLMDYFLAKLPAEIDTAKVVSVMNRR